MAEPENRYEKRYAQADCYWGEKPSILCETLLGLYYELGIDLNGLQMLDLGCGEGRNALFMASRGLAVTGLDTARSGLDKMRRLADEKGLGINRIEADFNEFVFPQKYDLVFSTGAVHYIPPDRRRISFEYFQSNTVGRGFHAVSALVSKPFIPPAPDAEPQVVLFESGELMSYYRSWEILYTIETIFDCNSGGVPHRHAVNRLIARRPG